MTDSTHARARAILSVMSPLVGIVPDFEPDGRTAVELDVLTALENAGGEARIVAASPSAGAFDALLLCGGGFDLPPEWYGQRPVARIDAPRERRSRLERELLQVAEAEGLPVLGICGGAQLMAVHRGGSLIQDLATLRPGGLDHEPGAERCSKVHTLRLAADSELARITGCTELAVNSSHHQAIDRPGRGVRAVGWAPDQVIEAIEDASLRFWIGVQWHPERLADAASEALLGAFIAAACRERR